MDPNLTQECLELANRAKAAALELQVLSSQVKNRWLLDAADRIEQAGESILIANAKDLELAPSYGLTESAIDRLRLDPARLSSIAKALRDVAALADPVGECLGGSIRPNGLQIQKVRVPIGVILFIYESRPNVTADAAAIAIKSGNAIILRGGKEAFHSSRAIVEILQASARSAGIPKYSLQMVSTIEAIQADRLGDPSRRRVAGATRDGRSHHAGAQAFRRQLPCLCRSHSGLGPSPTGGGQFQNTEDGGLQRCRIVAGRCPNRPNLSAYACSGLACFPH